ncbi:hypothetical protein CR194_14855 [Salipaludibacillus keqinensis]|uniref:DUF86 domain-containing protein n=1 Tax=Salipaludibacillus keqinensis TaxID=2045207 RepID=A0A323TE36_9BACI|nr:DUF86 domain-containing protein [Salipaludibacillus keqinensis]PYZ92916.1 hypothetical protein CR194_14855 [Salipaludibacillus keqinensis]
MYFVDGKLMEKRLSYLESMIEEFSKMKLPETSESELALERMCHMMIEVMMDIGNQMIDGFIMRDPGSYEDIIHILVDEKVLSKDEGKGLETLIPWRKELIHHYIDLNTADLYHSFRKQSSTLLQFPGKIRKYVENELGPVSAFLPNKE